MWTHVARSFSVRACVCLCVLYVGFPWTHTTLFRSFVGARWSDRYLTRKNEEDRTACKHRITGSTSTSRCCYCLASLTSVKTLTFPCDRRTLARSEVEPKQDDDGGNIQRHQRTSVVKSCPSGCSCESRSVVGGQACGGGHVFSSTDVLHLEMISHRTQSRDCLS